MNKRRLLAILASLSLLACIVCLLMWLRSGFVIDLVGRDSARLVTLSSGGGGLRLVESWYSPAFPPRPVSWSWSTMTSSSWSGMWKWEWWPSSSSRSRTVPPNNKLPAGLTMGMREASLPYWIPTFMTAILPGLWLGRWARRRSRSGSGLCRECGYDLRASPIRCPECGLDVHAGKPRAWCLSPHLLHFLGIVAVIYGSWLAMMAIHELGHILFAQLSGGKISLVYFRWNDFSRTDLVVNPHPLFVAWGGAIVGSLLPLFAYGLIHLLRVRGQKLALFFAGFCLVANGVYIGTGWVVDGGDCRTLLRQGVPPWVMATVGTVALAAGVYLWHRLGPRFGLGKRSAATAKTSEG